MSIIRIPLWSKTALLGLCCALAFFTTSDAGPFGIGNPGKLTTSGTPSDDTYSGTVITGVNCGESISQWDLVFMDDSSAEWLKADANAAGKFPAIGMATEACADGNPGVILVDGVVRNDGWAATITGDGKALYLSETAGGITETQPSDSNDCVQHIGRVISDANNTILLRPSLIWVELS